MVRFLSYIPCFCGCLVFIPCRMFSLVSPVYAFHVCNTSMRGFHYIILWVVSLVYSLYCRVGCIPLFCWVYFHIPFILRVYAWCSFCVVTCLVTCVSTCILFYLCSHISSFTLCVPCIFRWCLNHVYIPLCVFAACITLCCVLHVK